MATKKSATKKSAPQPAKQIAELQKQCEQFEKRITLLEKHLQHATAARPTVTSTALSFRPKAFLLAASPTAAAPAGAPPPVAAAPAPVPMALGGNSVDPQYAQRAAIVALKALEANINLPEPDSQGIDLNVPADFRKYVRACEAIVSVISLHNATYAALAGAAAAITAAHNAASQVTVTPPDGTNMAAIVADLTTLSNAIKADQRFEAVLSLLEAAAVAYSGL